jgi:ParB family chromosome partitioning protein
MARKNLIEVSRDNDETTNQGSNTDLTHSRPLAGFVPAARTTPVGGISKSLGNITHKVERVDALEKQLAEGQVVVELDPSLIENSFVSDRLSIDPEHLAELVAQIRDNGQLVPILVRPHPEKAQRFQVAFGHRRLAAARELGIKIRAVVRSLTDEQLVVNQGQENNARANLSFIERAVFAARLEDRGFSREVAMAALGIDKAAISKMLSVVRATGHELIEKIGSAPEVGRRRWLELSEQLEASQVDTLIAELSADNLAHSRSDDRFQFVADFVKRNKSSEKTSPQPANKQPAKSWSSTDNSVQFTMSRKARRIAIELSSTNAAAFGDWISNHLDRLYDEYQTLEETQHGD